jgi:hypothetical protein
MQWWTYALHVAVGRGGGSPQLVGRTTESCEASVSLSAMHHSSSDYTGGSSVNYASTMP